MFFVARRFHLSRPFATMAGILYGLSGYIVVRGTVHFSLTMYWVIPLQVLTASWLASRRGIPFRSKKFAATLAVGVITGWSFIYYAFFGMQLYALALLVRMGRPKRVQPLVVAAALATVTFAAIVSMSLDSVLYVRANGVNQAATYRSPTDVEMYALKPLSLLVPGPHHKWEFGRQLAARAAEQSMIQGEIPAPYLGLVPNLMLLGLVVAAAMAIAQRKLNLSVTWAFTVAWFIIGHSVGGENSLMGLGGVRLLRSVNRVSIVILTFVLLFGAWALTKLSRKVPAAVQWAVALGLGVFGTSEAVPTLVTAETIANNHRVFESDKALVAAAEAVLPKGSAVFELPVMDFPEVPPFAGVDSYELYRPYFYAEHLRFSHGDVKGRPNAGWKFRVGGLQPPAMMTELKANGFSSLYINLKGFPGREQAVIDAFVSSGAHVIAKAEVGDSVFLGL
jgi:phosphoglycerol transferase